MVDRPTIELAKDDPFLVKSLENLENSRGEPISVKPVMELCRCGVLETKPFCEGIHWSIEFKDGQTDAG